MAGKRRKKEEEQTELFGRTYMPDEILLRLELNTAKENFAKLQEQWDEMWKLYETVRDQNEFLRKELGL